MCDKSNREQEASKVAEHLRVRAGAAEALADMGNQARHALPELV